MNIKEVIVVEGIHDQERILKYMDVDIIVSGGKGFDETFLKTCKQLNETRGIIVFTDPDGPGEYIRRSIIDYVGTCKHASLHVLQSKRKNKVGIEHASKEDIISALESVATFDVKKKSLDWTDYLDLGCVGQANSQTFRNKISEHLKIPVSNAKTQFKYLNMLGITIDTLKEVLK